LKKEMYCCLLRGVVASLALVPAAGIFSAAAAAAGGPPTPLPLLLVAVVAKVEAVVVDVEAASVAFILRAPLLEVR
jgi:hypothetical protein